MSITKFPGFPLGMLHFLEELAGNNNKPWFDQHKQRYEAEVRGPALDFIRAMEKPLAAISPHFLAVPKKVGGSLMRPYRDVRFSKDKTPYKTNVGIHFRHQLGKDVHCPGMYLHIATDEVFVGSGIWHPDSSALGAIRAAIDHDPTAWKRAKGGGAFRQTFDLAGESLSRPPRGYTAEHPLILDLKRKDHFAVCKLDHDELFDATVVKTVGGVLKRSKAYLKFLCGAVGVDF